MVGGEMRKTLKEIVPVIRDYKDIIEWVWKVKGVSGESKTPKWSYWKECSAMSHQ